MTTPRNDDWGQDINEPFWLSMLLIVVGIVMCCWAIREARRDCADIACLVGDGHLRNGECICIVEAD